MSKDLTGVLLGIGNPLLDISATVEQPLLDKYDLKRANAVLADPEKHLTLFTDLQSNYQVEYTAGGAAQNSIRGAQWMLQIPGATNYIGCVGSDENGKNMKQAAESYGVTTHYLVDESTPTGTCAVLITDKERSMVAFLGAAEKYKMSHFESAEIQAIVNKAQYFYMTGFFLTHSTEVLVAIGKHGKEHNKPVMFNLSAPFLIDFFWDSIDKVLPYTDVVFCNETEAATLGKKLNWGTDLEEISKKLVAYRKENTQRNRIVIFTEGSSSTIVAQHDKVERFKPIYCSPEELVDTNGAGDAFVGGFLSQFVQEKSIEDCIKGAHYAAWECIRLSGATFPSKPNFQ